MLYIQVQILELTQVLGLTDNTLRPCESFNYISTIESLECIIHLPLACTSATIIDNDHSIRIYLSKF